MLSSRLIPRTSSRRLVRQAYRGVLLPSISTRALATVVSSFPQTQISTLPNGLTVATESHPHSETAAVGIWIDSGSRADIHGGTAHFLEHLAFKGTQKRNQQTLELEIEDLGAHLNAYTSRENTCYFTRSFSEDVPHMTEILSDILLNSKLDPGAIERERSVILREQEEVDKAHEEVVFDHLHATAFQGEALGKTILGPKEAILSIQRSDLVQYIKTNYTADRMALVGAGGLNHEMLVDLAKQHFGSLPTSASPIPLGGRGQLKPTTFTGSEVRIRDDTMDTLNLAIAVEGVGWNSPDLFPVLVMQAIFGNWERSMGSSALRSSRLSHLLSSNKLVNSFLSFSTSYSDTGLWGIYMVTENLTNVDDLVYLTLREWQRMSTAPTPIEVERAKSQLKASLLFSLDSFNNIADDIGRQLVSSGKRMTPQEIQAAVEVVTPDTIRQVAQKYLWDKDIAVAALGRTEGLLDYNRIRANMSSLTW